MNKFERIVIVGLGGNTLIKDFFGFLVGRVEPQFKIELVDGGKYKISHFDHEKFPRLGNKALVTQEILQNEYKNLQVHAVPFYLSNIRSKNSKLPEDVIKDGDIIILCVDNYATINLVSHYCSTQKNIILISGGIHEDNLHVQIYVRLNGKDITPPIHSYDMFAKNPKDKIPSEVKRPECLDMTKKERPNLFSLMMTDAISLCAFYSVLEEIKCGSIEKFKIKEIFFNSKYLKYRISENLNQR